MKRIFLIIILSIIACPSLVLAADYCCVCKNTNPYSDNVVISCVGSNLTDEACSSNNHETPTVHREGTGDKTVCTNVSGLCSENTDCGVTGTGATPTEVMSEPPTLSVSILGTSQMLKPIETCSDNKDFYCITWIGDYVVALYTYGITLAAILAVVMIMAGGFLWLTSGGSPDRLGKGKEIILGAISGLLLALFSFIILYAINPRLVNFQPLRVQKVKSITEEMAEYAGQSCPSDEEKKSGFSSYVTGYCQPKREDYPNEGKFLCDVGLNCTCPAGQDTTKVCTSSSLTWHPCKPFDTAQPYCNQTASGATPEKGQVAADWSCFAKGTLVCIGNNTYTVTDKGKAITGRRFDVWSETCNEAMQVTGTYTVTVGSCN